MAVNNKPLLPGKPFLAITPPITVANTAKDGTGTVTEVVAPVGTYGAFIEEARIVHFGANPSTAVIRLFLNNGSSNTVATNNILWYEATIGAGSSSVSGADEPAVITINKAIPAGYRILATATQLSAGYCVTVAGGDYLNVP